ncbi:hypothetical protein [Kaarinaea lacus]
MKKYTALYGFLAILLGCVSFTASAGSNNYPAAMCVKWNSSQPTPLLSSSRIFNDSTSRMYVDCPAVRDDFDGFLHSSAVESSWLSAIDTNPNDAVCTTLVKYRHSGFTSTAQSASLGQRCTTINSGASLFSEKLPQGSLSLGHSDYHLYFSVRVPGTFNGTRSGIVTYNVDQ